MDTPDNYFTCTVCGKRKVDNHRKKVRCSNCAYKEQYFGGLYKKVLDRDKCTCQECGKVLDTKTPRSLNVHHINHDNKDNRMDNLEVLCVSCHAKKRVFDCVGCGDSVQATSAGQKRCKPCGKYHYEQMSYIHQARFWKKRGSEKRVLCFESKLEGEYLDKYRDNT